MNTAESVRLGTYRSSRALAAPSRPSQAILTTMTSASHTVGFVINYTEDSPHSETKMTSSGFKATRTPDSCVQKT